MKYSIKLNAVNNPDKNVKAFATVTFGDCFKITNIAVVKTQEVKCGDSCFFVVKEELPC